MKSAFIALILAIFAAAKILLQVLKTGTVTFLARKDASGGCGLLPSNYNLGTSTADCKPMQEYL